MKKTTWKLAAIVLVVFLTFGAVTAGALALFTDRDGDNVDVIVGDVHVVLDEDFAAEFDADHPDYGSDTDMKVFRVISQGNKRTYVRARFFVTAEYKDEDSGEWITIGSVSQDDFSYSVNAPLWIDGEDGWWYYSQLLRPNSEGGPSITEDFFIYDVALNKLPASLEDKHIRVTITVRIEGSQATHEAWKKHFGIDALPDGVEPIE